MEAGKRIFTAKYPKYANKFRCGEAADEVRTDARPPTFAYFAYFAVKMRFFA
jgi:hypothetical protein